MYRLIGRATTANAANKTNTERTLRWFMAQRRHHYEAAFEGYLRQRRIPYVAVDEAKKSLLPGSPAGVGGVRALKSFDFVLYGQGNNLLAEVKGRRVASPRRLVDGDEISICGLRLRYVEAARRRSRSATSTATETATSCGAARTGRSGDGC